MARRRRLPSRVCLGLGANLGEAAANLRRALELLAAKRLGRVIARSSLYRTEPVGPADQPWFINGAAVVETWLEPLAFHAGLVEIERELGRPQERIKDGPRIIDLDVLLWEDRVIELETLIVPHPRMSGRRFVLAPLAEIAPAAVHPLLQKTVARLFEELEDPAAAERIGPF